jgi:hypothetical protein
MKTPMRAKLLRPSILVNIRRSIGATHPKCQRRALAEMPDWSIIHPSSRTWCLPCFRIYPALDAYISKTVLTLYRPRVSIQSSQSRGVDPYLWMRAGPRAEAPSLPHAHTNKLCLARKQTRQAISRRRRVLLQYALRTLLCEARQSDACDAGRTRPSGNLLVVDMRTQ